MRQVLHALGQSAELFPLLAVDGRLEILQMLQLLQSAAKPRHLKL